PSIFYTNFLGRVVSHIMAQRDDAETEFHLEVPPGGCIDSWSGDTHYEGDVGEPVPDGFGGWRVYKGTVYTKGMTYRIANCKPTNTPVSSIPTPSLAELLCPFAIKQSEVDSWRIGVADVPTVQSYINNFDSRRPGDGGAFKVGTKIPAGILVATNFDEQDANKWSQYPVIAVVHSGSWGLFQTTKEYIAPNAGACLLITE
ncbi:MAG: hypothetical protein HYR94_26255, partial [Chloroflexi bacterium]|nr:hypothetical protein [Chloroflexota bacterium]